MAGSGDAAVLECDRLGPDPRHIVESSGADVIRTFLADPVVASSSSELCVEKIDVLAVDARFNVLSRIITCIH
jgi:hypothetical protein